MSDRHGERDLTASIRELAATLERGLRDHPTPEELRSFVAGDLPANREEWVEEHLALCRECARKAVELAEVPEIGSGRRGELVSEAEIDAQWRRFQAAAGISRRWRPKIAALAAALLVGVLGMAAWIFQREMQSRTDVYLVDLSASTVRGEGDTAQIPEWARHVQLVIDPPYQMQVFPEYQVEIRAKDGRQIVSERIYPQRDHTLAIQVPRRSLPVGAYKVRIFSPERKELAVYDLLIEP